MNKNKDILNQLKLKETSANFTEKVMQDIYALDLAKEKALKNMIKEQTLLSTSTTFEQSILAKIEKKQTIFKPIEIFSTTQKMFIALCVLAVLFIAIFSKNESVIPNFDFKNYFNFQLNLDFIPNLPLMSISVICITLLLLIDYSLKKVKTN